MHLCVVNTVNFKFMRYFYILFSSIFLYANIANAQSGILDTTFNYGGSGPGGVSDNTINAISVISSGKILVAGHFLSFNGNPNYKAIARLNADGGLDTSFIALPDWKDNSYIYALAVQQDGKIIVGGQFPNNNGAKAIIRLNADGSIDNTFTDMSAMYNSINSIAIQADGKILIGGKFSQYDGVGRSGIARLNTDGTLDTSFLSNIIGIGGNTGYEQVNTLHINTDGKILVGGNFQKFNGKNFKNLVRLFPDGNLDSTFNTSNGIQGFVNKIKPLSNGKVFIVGNFTQINSKQFNRVARLNDNGSADTTFNPALFTSYPSISGANLDVYDIIILEDNKIIIGGKFSKYNNISRNGIVRINSDGSIDNNFLIGTGIHFTNGGIKALSIQEDGKILAGGLFDKYNNFQQSGIIRINNQTTSTGISTIMSSSKLNIYPNPTTGKVYIQSDKNNEIESIVIRNSIGQEIYTNKHITENSNEIELVGKSGIYYVEIISGNQKITKKLIKK